ncbi:MAG: hypothetical protein FWC28_09035 [Proteobacteria bacterium]|nr:hypothetical protein [Pseudomonadota bacterium]
MPKVKQLLDNTKTAYKVNVDEENTLPNTLSFNSMHLLQTLEGIATGVE